MCYQKSRWSTLTSFYAWQSAVLEGGVLNTRSQVLKELLITEIEICCKSLQELKMIMNAYQISLECKIPPFFKLNCIDINFDLWFFQERVSKACEEILTNFRLMSKEGRLLMWYWLLVTHTFNLRTRNARNIWIVGDSELRNQWILGIWYK